MQGVKLSQWESREIRRSQEDAVLWGDNVQWESRRISSFLKEFKESRRVQGSQGESSGVKGSQGELRGVKGSQEESGGVKGS